MVNVFAGGRCIGRPTRFRASSRRSSKLVAVLIALTGMMLTGIVVALALNAATFAFKATHDVDALRQTYGLEAPESEAE